MTDPTDDEIDALVAAYLGDCGPQATRVYSFVRAVLAKWGTPPAVAGEKVYLVATGLTNEAGTVGLYERHDRFVPLADCEVLYTAPQPTQAQAGSVTADDLKQPRNGAQWRVEWWNESCRMLLPANKRLDSFQTYRNGTLMFTIKEKSGIKGGQHGAE